MSSLTVEEMRQEIMHKCGYSPAWKRKCMNMFDEQVIAIWHRFHNEEEAYKAKMKKERAEAAKKAEKIIPEPDCATQLIMGDIYE